MREIDLDQLRDLVQQGLRRPQIAAALGVSTRTLNYRLAASEELRAAATRERKPIQPLERPIMARCRAGDWRAIRRVSTAKGRSKILAETVPNPGPSAEKPGTKPLAVDLNRLTALIATGATLTDTAAALGISRATFLRRRKTSREVRDAINRGNDFTGLILSDARLSLAEAGHWPAARLSMLIRVGWIDAGLGIKGASGALNEHLRAVYSAW